MEAQEGHGKDRMKERRLKKEGRSEDYYEEGGGGGENGKLPEGKKENY
jgi:hypothetical protein